MALSGALRRRRVVLAAISMLVLLGLGAVWAQWLVSEVASAPAQQGHHDFFAFFAAGSLIGAHEPGLLYSAPTLTGIERHIVAAPVGAAGYMPFLNPPAAATILAPLSALTEPQARIVWLLLSAALAVACVLVASAGLQPWLRAAAALLLLTSYPAFQAFVEGQWSFVLLLAALGALVAARRGHQLLAGAAIAVLWLKPPLLLLVLVWVVATRRWRVAGAAVATVVAFTLVALPWTGISSNLDYLSFLGGVGASHATGAGAAGATQWEGGLLGMEGLLGLAATVAGQQRALLVDALTIGASSAVVAVFVVATRSRLTGGALTTRDGMGAICLALLLDPHLYAQDCVLLIVALAIGLREARTPSAQLTLILACTAVMDLTALDTLWTAGMPLWPPHLFTIALALGVVVLSHSRTHARAPAGESPALARAS